jgi:hypothetical protein
LLSREPFFPVRSDFLGTFNLGSELRDLAKSFEVLPGCPQVHKPPVSKNPSTA